MGKVSFDNGIDSVRGIIMGSDPFYLRRYRCKDGRILHIVQARPRKWTDTPARKAAREKFVERYARRSSGEE